MIKRLFFVFIFLLTVADASVVIVQSRTSNISFSEGMFNTLSGFTETKRYGVEDKFGLIQIAATKPKMLVILSASTARDYVKLIREGEIFVPHITIPDAPLREEDVEVLMQNGLVCIPSISPAPVIRRITEEFNLSAKQSVGYIYGDENRNTARNETALLKAENIPVSSRLLKYPLLTDEFTYDIGHFNMNGVMLYRICGGEPFLSFFENNPDMISFLGARATAVIADSPQYLKLFAKTPIVLLQQDDEVIAQIATITVMAALRDLEAGNKPRFSHPLRIYSTSARLFTEENRDGKNLIDGRDLLFAQIDRINKQIKNKSQSADDLWGLYVSTLSAVIDTNKATDKNSMVISVRAEMKDRFDRFVGTQEFGYAALIVIMIILFAMILIILIQAHHRNIYKRRLALVMPATLAKMPLVCTDGNAVSLKILLDNEGYQMKAVSSFEASLRVMRKNFPNILFADWDAAGSMLQSFYQEFTDSHKYSQVAIVLTNIPLIKQAQIKKLFGGASVYCYETTPTLDDVQAHLRGDRHFSSYSDGSYMSGVIHEDNLTAVLQMIEGNMYTGCLVVEEEKPVSVIYFKSGRVVFAVDKSGESGVKSIYNALNCRRGNFYFHLNRTAQSETLNLGSIEILMGWAEQRDRFTNKIDTINR